MTLWVCQGNFKAFLQRYSWIDDIEGRSIEMRKKKQKKNANLRDRDTLLRMCGILISGPASLFSRLAFGEKILFH